ncbi:MAG: GntR family transcriptional regulator, partial [Planctomycetaceae bacterium]|nr:GntR family transcriptional regulator [Planctomycetaceae bacterium]
NMMTVSKAYSNLESEGLVERVRGMGMRVLKPVASGTIKQREEKLLPLIESAVTRGLQLGLSEDQIISLMTSVLKERKK